MDPAAVCQNITLQLDAAGNATVSAAQIDNGSSDNCGIASIVLDGNSSSLDFDCSSVGTQAGLSARRGMLNVALPVDRHGAGPP